METPPPLNAADAAELYEAAARRADELLARDRPDHEARAIYELLRDAQAGMRLLAEHWSDRPELARKYRDRETDCNRLAERVMEVWFLDLVGLRPDA